MRTRTKLVPLALGTLLVLGIPPVLVLTAVSSPEDGPAAATSRNPLRALLAQPSNVERFYLGWQKRYLARGGDRNVDISLAWTPSLSTEPSQARGRVHLDLIAGSLRAEVRGLDGQPADLWLVDNQEGPGMTALPQPGDRMIKVGSLRTNGGVATLSARLVPSLFRGFELDLAVVSRPGRTPAESSVLAGTRPFFERLYTRTRLARETTRARNARLFGPASMLAWLSPRSAEAGPTEILVAQGLVSQAVADGADLFFRGTFEGNGRTCGTCHRAANNLGLDLDFISTLPADDNLFIAELPPEQGGVPGLERPALMRGHAQILMNVDGFENPTSKFVMRGIPHALSLATSIGVPVSTGWGGDVGNLRLLTNTAVKQHFTKRLNRVEGTDFVPATDAELDAMEAFMLAGGRLNALNLGAVVLTNAAAQAGRLQFLRIGCNGCHFNAGATFPGNFNPNFRHGVERAPDPSQATEPHPHDGGFGVAINPNFDCDGDRTLDCFGNGTFNVPPLIEAADTEPFFHNNSAATLEEAVTHYTTEAFRQAEGTTLPLTEKDILDISAFLRVLNAAFNSAISIQRNNAALALEKSNTAGTRTTVNMLLALSSSEAADAIEVLNHRKLHLSSIALLQRAITRNNGAMAARSTKPRQALIQAALNDLKAAKAKLGKGLDFTLGEGNLLF
jgi:cytochrome c peroxidase